MEPIVIKPRDPEQRNFLLELIRRLGVHTKLYVEKLDEELLQALEANSVMSEIKQKQIPLKIRDEKRIDELITEIEKLDYSDRITVITRILGLLKVGNKTRESIPITRLKGLGKEVWQKTNTDAYITNERKAWD